MNVLATLLLLNLKEHLNYLEITYMENTDKQEKRKNKITDIKANKSA